MIINNIRRPWSKEPYQRKSPDTYYQSTAWKNIVDYIWKRDNGICQLCKQEGKVHILKRGTKDLSMQGTVDHKKQRKQGGSDDYDNLWLIGTNHHYAKSANEGNKK